MPVELATRRELDLEQHGSETASHQRLKAPRPPLLVFADDWGRHPSSCQHLVQRLRKDYQVLWANSIGTRRVRINGFTLRRGIEKLKNWNKGVTTVDDRMWLVDLPMLPGQGSRFARGVNRRLVCGRLERIFTKLGLSEPIVLTTLPYIADLIGDLPRQRLIYYCTDDYSHWPGADRASLQNAEQTILEVADMVLAVSTTLQSRLAAGVCRGACHYFPHGADIEHFAAVRNLEPPPEILKLPGPRIGFFGLIYEKLDFELLAAVARKFASGSLVLIGPESYCPDWFRSLANVHFLGPRPYAELPKWIAGMDVLLLPYVNDEMIRQSDPLKLRECLATGKPTVSIDIPEVRHYRPHVRVASTTDEFVYEVEAAVADKSNNAAIDARQQSVAADGWDRRASQLRSWLEELATQ